MTRIRLVPIFFIVVVTLAALIGGWQAYQHFGLMNPLETKLKQIPGIETFHVSPDSNHVTIQLGPVSHLQNGDLQATYDRIVALTGDSLGQNATISLHDKRNWNLTDAYETYMMWISEGRAKGTYTQMSATIEEKAKTDHINARVTMDKHNIYIQLSQGNSYLYDVIPYSIYQGGASS